MFRSVILAIKHQDKGEDIFHRRILTFLSVLYILEPSQLHSFQGNKGELELPNVNSHRTFIFHTVFRNVF